MTNGELSNFNQCSAEPLLMVSEEMIKSCVIIRNNTFQEARCRRSRWIQTWFSVSPPPRLTFTQIVKKTVCFTGDRLTTTPCSHLIKHLLETASLPCLFARVHHWRHHCAATPTTLNVTKYLTIWSNQLPTEGRQKKFRGITRPKSSRNI